MCSTCISFLWTCCTLPGTHIYILTVGSSVIHNVKLSMNPRYKEGFGLTDGEVLERLWSFLRRFCKMTKEMRPSHRIDVLTDALLHYCRLSSRNLSKYNNNIYFITLFRIILHTLFRIFTPIKKSQSNSST